MRPNCVFGLLVAFAGGVGGFVISQTDLIDSRSHHNDHDYKLEQRTFLFGKLVLVPVLAALGLKFLALVPIVLSKIAVLSVMNFLSTNLNLLVSTLFGMKSFLGKHGLWAHEPTKNTSGWETFDWSTIQPGLKYGYMPAEPLEGRIETSIKPPKMLKFYNDGLGGSYKWTTFDRRTKPSRLLPVKQQRSTEGQGKYKCFWTTDTDDSAYNLRATNTNSNNYDATKTTTGYLNSPIYTNNNNNYDATKTTTGYLKSPIYDGQLASYVSSTNTVDPTIENQITVQSYYDFQPMISSSTAEITEQQYIPGKLDESSDIPETVTSYVSSPSFTEAVAKAV